MLRVLNKTNEVTYANICTVAEVSYIFRSSGILRMLLSVLDRPRIIELSAFSK